MKKAQKFLSYKEMVHELPGEIAPGDYEIQFSADLPDRIPSSFHFKDKGNRENPKAKVKYYCKAVLKCDDEEQNMKHKQVLAVREKAVEMKTDEKIAETSELKTWGCCAQGTSTLEAEFNKNVFTPQETAEGELKIDNSHCKLKVTRVRFSIEQELRQHIGHHHNAVTKTIIAKDIEGPDAEAGDWSETMKINLDDIKYEVAEMKTKKGKQKKVSKEDQHMMASLQPACHTKKFSNEYFLCVTTEYDGCVCCVDLPDARMKMTIIPSFNPELFGYIPPHQWEP